MWLPLCLPRLSGGAEPCPAQQRGGAGRAGAVPGPLQAPAHPRQGLLPDPVAFPAHQVRKVGRTKAWLCGKGWQPASPRQ